MYGHRLSLYDAFPSEAGDLAEDRRGDRLPRVGDGLGLLAGRVLAEHLAEPVTRHLADGEHVRSEEHTSELQSLMRISYAVFSLEKKITSVLSNNSRTSTKLIPTYT